VSRPSAIVVGLGALGSAAALHLARAGWDVLGIDRWTPPHRHGSTHGESRITRATAWEGAQYVPLVARANAILADLAAESGLTLGVRCGGLFVGRAHEFHIAGSKASADATGLPYELLDRAAMARRWPEVVVPEGMVGFFDPGAGVLYPERIVETQLRLAEQAGAEFVFEAEVLDHGVDGDAAWVRTAAGAVHADRVLLCAGAWMPDVLEELGVALTVERVSQHWFRERAGAPARHAGIAPVLLASDGHGHATAAFPTLDGRIKGAGHGSGVFTTADVVDREIRPADIAPVESLLRQWLPQHIGAHSESATCLYTCTPHQQFILDRHPEHPQLLYGSACNGFGFKFAAASGEILAALAQGVAPPVDPTPWRLPQR
jgi:sarcosine oxidase